MNDLDPDDRGPAKGVFRAVIIGACMWLALLWWIA